MLYTLNLWNVICHIYSIKQRESLYQRNNILILIVLQDILKNIDNIIGASNKVHAKTINVQ